MEETQETVRTEISPESAEPTAAISVAKPPEGRRDGRTERGARNREAILDSVYRLIQKEERMPTAERVADLAGVGIRTVFRHFADMETLYAEVYDRVFEHSRTYVDAPIFTGPIEDRARSVIARRCELFEYLAAFRRAFNYQRDRSSFLRAANERTAALQRERLLANIPELDVAAPHATDALDLLSSFEAWNRLRIDQGLSSRQTQDCLEMAFIAILRETIH